MVFKVEHITDNFNAATYHLPVLPPPAGHDPDKPNNVIFSLFDGIDRYAGKISAIKWNLPDPVVYEAVSCGERQETMDCLIGTLRDHVLKHGTIDELDLAGHGSSLFMAARSGGFKINLNDFFYELDALEQELGQKICHRVVFQGCSTFSNLSDERISYLRDYADEHDMEVVGTTSIRSSGFSVVNTARYVQFTPDGNVIRDPLDDRYAPIALQGASGGNWVAGEIDKNEDYQKNKAASLKK